MNFIHGGRGSGKTIILVKQSAATGIPIMVDHYHRVPFLKNDAEMLNLKIPEPIVWRNEHMEGKLGKYVLVDNGEALLTRLLLDTSGCICTAMAISDPVIHLTSCFLDGYIGIPEEYKGGRLDYADAAEFEAWRKENVK